MNSKMQIITREDLKLEGWGINGVALRKVLENIQPMKVDDKEFFKTSDVLESLKAYADKKKVSETVKQHIGYLVFWLEQCNCSKSNFLRYFRLSFHISYVDNEIESAIAEVERLKKKKEEMILEMENLQKAG